MGTTTYPPGSPGAVGVTTLSTVAHRAVLLAHVIESVPTDHPMQTVRITFDLIRPVPMAPVTVATRIARHGRRIQLVAATMEAEGVEVALARALRIRIGDVELPEPPRSDWVGPPRPRNWGFSTSLTGTRKSVR